MRDYIDDSSPIDPADHIRRAKVTRYDHGGGRMYFEDEKGHRHLIADFYGDGQYREFILAALGRFDFHAEALHQDWQPHDSKGCRFCRGESVVPKKGTTDHRGEKQD